MNELVISFDEFNISQEEANEYVIDALEQVVDVCNPAIKIQVIDEKVEVCLIDYMILENNVHKRIRKISFIHYLDLLKYGLKKANVNNNVKTRRKSNYYEFN